MIIRLNAHENTLTDVTPEKIIRKGAINYYEIAVAFSPDWDGLTKIVALLGEDDEGNATLVSAYTLLNGRALIPYKSIKEAATAKEDDEFKTINVLVYGSCIVGENGEQTVVKRIVTNAVELEIGEPEYTGDA